MDRIAGDAKQGNFNPRIREDATYVSICDVDLTTDFNPRIREDATQTRE